MNPENSSYLEALAADEERDSTADLTAIAQALFRALSAVWGDMDLARQPAGGSDELHNLVKDALDLAQGLCPECRGAMRIQPQDPREGNKEDGLVPCPLCDSTGSAPEEWDELALLPAQKSFIALRITREMVAHSLENPPSVQNLPDSAMEGIARRVGELLRSNLAVFKRILSLTLKFATELELGPHEFSLLTDPSGGLALQKFLHLLDSTGWGRVGHRIYCPDHAANFKSHLLFGPLEQSDLEEHRSAEGILLSCDYRNCGTTIFQPSGSKFARESTPHTCLLCGHPRHTGKVCQVLDRDGGPCSCDAQMKVDYNELDEPRLPES